MTKDLDYDVYCNEMAKDKVWGDEVTMIAICEAFQLRILLWSSTVSESNYFSEHSPRAPNAPLRTILLCHVLELHYGSLFLNTPVGVESPTTTTTSSTTTTTPPSSVPADAQLRVLQVILEKKRIYI